MGNRNNLPIVYDENGNGYIQTNTGYQPVQQQPKYLLANRWGNQPQQPPMYQPQRPPMYRPLTDDQYMDLEMYNHQTGNNIG